MTYSVQDSGNITHLHNVSFEEAIYYIKMWAEERNLGAYYRHTFLENGNISIDYGSHTHIFTLTRRIGMKEYKLIAAKIERFDYREYIKARIFLEIQDLDIDHDPFVEYGYQVWENSEHLSAEEIGIAIHYGIDYHGLTDPEEVISQGLDYLRS